MKTKQYLLIGLCIFTIITALTNPKTEKHKEEVKLKINEFLEKKLDKTNNETNNQWSNAGSTLGNAFAKTMVNTMVDNMVSSSNYILFSTTNITFEGKTKIIGVGILGNVFLSNKINDVMN